MHPLLRLQRLIAPGPNGQRLTSLEAVRGRRISMATVRESLVRHLAARLGYPEYQIFTGHPLLKRTRRVTNVYA